MLEEQSSIDELISIMKKFPGLGLKSSKRIAFHLLKQDKDYLKNLGKLISGLKDGLCTCSQCGNISNKNPCAICSDPLRNRNILCIVEDIEALSAFESAKVYNGIYHVLGCKISQFDDETLSDEAMKFLSKHVKTLKPEEVIIATSPRIEGDMTFYAVMEILKNTNVKKISRIAYGLPIGSSIEFADKITLHTALESRRQVR